MSAIQFVRFYTTVLCREMVKIKNGMKTTIVNFSKLKNATSSGYFKD